MGWGSARVVRDGGSVRLVRFGFGRRASWHFWRSAVGGERGDCGLMDLGDPSDASSSHLRRRALLELGGRDVAGHLRARHAAPRDHGEDGREREREEERLRRDVIRVLPLRERREEDDDAELDAEPRDASRVDRAAPPRARGRGREEHKRGREERGGDERSRERVQPGGEPPRRGGGRVVEDGHRAAVQDGHEDEEEDAPGLADGLLVEPRPRVVVVVGGGVVGVVEPVGPARLEPRASRPSRADAVGRVGCPHFSVVI